MGVLRDHLEDAALAVAKAVGPGAIRHVHLRADELDQLPARIHHHVRYRVEVLERAVRTDRPILQLAIAPFPDRPVEGCEDALAVIRINSSPPLLERQGPAGRRIEQAAVFLGRVRQFS
jgi:hypothetical protein